jgi:lipopolysaccharide transport system permease protein
MSTPGVSFFQSMRAYFWPWQHADLIRQMAARDVNARFKQSWLGLAWLVLTPLLMLCVYTLVFREVFQARWGAPDEGVLAYALRLYAGLAVFNFFAEYVGRAPSFVVEQPHLVKKVVFPLEVVAWVNLASVLVSLCVAAVVLLCLRWAGLGSIPLSACMLPVVWLPLVPLCLGLGWALSALGTYVRDVGQVLGMIMSALVFVSPVFFPVEVLPKVAQEWMWLNPLAPIMTQTRTVLLLGQWPLWDVWLYSLLTGLCIALFGAVLFKRLRSGFADVL